MKEITGFLQFVAEGNEAKAKEHFEAAMAEKVSKTLDARKVAVAQKHFNEGTLDDALGEGRRTGLKFTGDTGKDLEAYAKKHGGIDKADILKVAKMLQRGDEGEAIEYASTLDTHPRNFILSRIDSDHRKILGLDESSSDEESLEEAKAVKIQITNDHALLKRQWNSAYADAHRGKVYDATIDSDGWAITKGAKFHPSVFKLI